MNYKIVTDSSADIRELSGVDFETVPLKIITDEREYVDDASLDVAGMLSDLKKYSGKSHTSCPSAGEYLNAFSGYDNVFCITITSNLSGSYNAANVAARAYIEEQLDGNIHIIDSLSTGPENALVIEKLRDLILSGESFEDIKEKIADYNLNHTRLIFALESMRNLANNGRVNPIVAKMAGLLGIRAIGRASDVGTLEMLDKCRGTQRAIQTLYERMKSFGYVGGRVRIATCFNPAAAEKLAELIKRDFPEADINLRGCRGLCSFYAERGGILVGFEKTAD
jgi:DegV family protein with EDD domain